MFFSRGFYSFCNAAALFGYLGELESAVGDDNFAGFLEALVGEEGEREIGGVFAGGAQAARTEGADAGF